jgi:hypothetical protein
MRHVRLGSEDFYPRSGRPLGVRRRVLDERNTLVTAAEFRRFVRETKYVTVAERPLGPEQ